jgi:hypothetical protein
MPQKTVTKSFPAPSHRPAPQARRPKDHAALIGLKWVDDTWIPSGRPMTLQHPSTLSQETLGKQLPGGFDKVQSLHP